MARKSKFSLRDQGNIWLWVAGDGDLDELAKAFGVSVEDIKTEVRRQLREMKVPIPKRKTRR